MQSAEHFATVGVTTIENAPDNVVGENHVGKAHADGLFIAMGALRN